MMSEELHATDAALRSFVEEIVRIKGLSLPSIALSIGRQSYLRFLEENGYREEEVLPLFDTTKSTIDQRTSVIPLLLAALKSENMDLLTDACFAALTNLIIDELCRRLVADLQKSSQKITELYAGVFPTDSCNAQAVSRPGVSLVLIDTGYMETIEAAVNALLCEEALETRAAQLGAAIDDYVLHRIRPDPSRISHEGIGPRFGPIRGLLVSSSEEFIITHEIGHLSLGHVQPNKVRHMYQQAGEGPMVAQKSHFEELQADAWAIQALYERGKKRNDEDRIAIAAAGPAIALGLGYLIECGRRKHQIAYDDSHPRASLRMYMNSILTEVLGIRKQGYLGRRFAKLLAACRDCYFPGEQAQLWSVESDIEIFKVLQSFGIPLPTALELGQSRLALLGERLPI